LKQTPKKATSLISNVKNAEKLLETKPQQTIALKPFWMLAAKRNFEVLQFYKEQKQQKKFKKQTNYKIKQNGQPRAILFFCHRKQKN
jgi:hypothetical protein